VAFDNLELMSVRDRAGVLQHQKLFSFSGGPKEPATGREFAQVIAEAAGLDGDGALATRESDAFFGADGFGFDDFIDLINPLQHIPIVSAIYREITGDTISDGARIFGGAIFGGPLGLATAIGDVAIKQVSGKYVGELALALFDSDMPKNEITTAGLPPEPHLNGLEALGLSEISPASGPAPVARDEKAALLALQADPAARSAHRAVPDYLERMSDEQKALLLSSVGLTPTAADKSEPREAARKTAEIGAEITAEINPRIAADITAKIANEIPFVRAAATLDNISAKSNKLDWPEAARTPGVDLNSPESVAKAMARALDKYDQMFNATRQHGDHVDSKI
jgi:hypothetical protein